jgi:16S rRNA (adenine1518-N6/adenine1519-N6)-dimethyltransferase
VEEELFQELQSLMVRHRFMPDKSYSQNFIVDKDLIESILFHARLKKGDTVLEIGPGVGFLTQELVKKCKVIVVEADPKMAAILRERVKDADLSIIEGDFLTVKLPEFNRVVSLPPYSISTRLVGRLLEAGFESAYLVFQKEFAEKLRAEPGFPDYCALSVITRYYCRARVLIEQIKPSSFYPKPKSFSSLVELKYSRPFGKVGDEELFNSFINMIFRYRNKNLRNAVMNSARYMAEHSSLSEQDLAKRVDALKLKDEKVGLIEVADYIKIFSSLFP